MAEFARLGCEPAVLCARGTACSRTHFAVARFYVPRLRYLPFRLLAARFLVERVCCEWQPDLIVPLDDFAGWLLRGLATNPSVSAKFRCLLEYSLGSTSGYEAICSRTKFLELATRIGVHVPASFAVDRATALSVAEAMGTVNPQPYGPSSVIRHTENAEMRAIATKLVETLGLSGFASFDFVISQDGKPFLIELNPRCTPALHLGRLFGQDLCASLAHHLGWLEEPPENPLLPKETAVALFPKEMQRDPESAWLGSESGVLHDIPWDDPNVVKHCYRRLLLLHPSHSAEIAHLLHTEEANMAMPV
jgi:hypothetical protein